MEQFSSSKRLNIKNYAYKSLNNNPNNSNSNGYQHFKNDFQLTSTNLHN